MKFSSDQWKCVLLLYLSLTLVTMALLMIKISKTQAILTGHLARIETILTTQHKLEMMNEKKN